MLVTSSFLTSRLKKLCLRYTLGIIVYNVNDKFVVFVSVALFTLPKMPSEVQRGTIQDLNDSHQSLLDMMQDNLAVL